MKKLKRYAALLAVVVLLAAFGLPMVFALKGWDEGSFSRGLFQASLLGAFFVPVMAFVILMVYRILQDRNPKQEENRMIKNVIFDVGNVLLDFDWETYLNSFDFSEEEYEKIADATFRSPIWNERDRGLYQEEDYIRQFVAKAPEYEADIREVMRRSPETLHRFPYSETWVKYLKKQGYHLYILSNYSQYMLEKTRDIMDFLKYMDGIVFSCEVRELKPEEGIYKKLLNMYQLEPEKSVFLDDRAENCEGARACGIHAIQFKDFKQAANELEKLGVK